MQVSIVIPVHNEASTLPDAVPALLSELDGVDATFDITLVENGSSDDTVAVASSLAGGGLRVISLPEADYGAAMRRGFLEARGDLVVNFDIDYFSGAFVTASIDADSDVVLASKRVAGADDTRSLLRRTATAVFNMLIRLLFRTSVTDTHGMKALRREVVSEIGPKVVSTKDLFDTELVLRAERAGYRITEIPAVVVETRDARSGLWSRVPRTLAGLARLRVAMWRRP